MSTVQSSSGPAGAPSLQQGEEGSSETSTDASTQKLPASPARELTAIVLAAGMGTRMKSQLPKVLHPVAGRPMLLHVCDALRVAGLKRIIVVVGHGAHRVRAALDPDLQTVEQPVQLGSADAVARARPLAGSAGHVLVVNGDLPLVSPETIGALIRFHLDCGAALSFATVRLADPSGYGRVLRDDQDRVRGIVEEEDATPVQRSIDEVNAGLYCMRADRLWRVLPQLPRSAKGEFYLTDLVGAAVVEGLTVCGLRCPDAAELMGVNDRLQLAAAEQALRDRVRRRHMLNGVTILDPATTYIDAAAIIGADTVVYPNTFIQGATVIGEECEIGPSSIIRSSVIGNRCRIFASVVEDSHLLDGVGMGPWSRVRNGTLLEEEVDLGNYAEIKKSRVGRRTKMHHFSYVGDADVGEGVNIGAGTITCNYDGVRKNRTIIGDHAFIGSDTMLVAPVEIGARAVTGAGAVVTKDVPPDTLAVGVPARQRPKRENKERPREE